MRVRHNRTRVGQDGADGELATMLTRRVGELGFLLARPRGFEPLTFAFGGGSSTLI